MVLISVEKLDANRTTATIRQIDVGVRLVPITSRRAQLSVFGRFGQVSLQAFKIEMANEMSSRTAHSSDTLNLGLS